ncbi:MULTISPECIES: hypothetical protein [Salinicola]|jgi:hypothetical protein|uniref:hypothetical protein n=1 Tax=Salinicola salarius TaxID=430457 RepID=UPI00358DEFD5
MPNRTGNWQFIAALVISRRGEELPAQGFFDLAVELGRFPADPAQRAGGWQFHD